jgi:hypothetical protein
MQKHSELVIFFLGVIIALSVFALLKSNDASAQYNNTEFKNEVGRYQFYAHPSNNSNWGIIDTKNGYWINLATGDFREATKEMEWCAVCDCFLIASKLDKAEEIDSIMSSLLDDPSTRDTFIRRVDEAYSKFGSSLAEPKDSSILQLYQVCLATHLEYMK